MAVMAVSYCAEWNTLLDELIDPISEEDARTRFEKGPRFTVVIHRQDNNSSDTALPKVTMLVEPQASVVMISRFTPAGSIQLIETYTRRDRGRVFLEQLIAYSYPGDGNGEEEEDGDGGGGGNGSPSNDEKFQLQEATCIDTFKFREDGVVKRVVDDKDEPVIHSEDRRGVDVSLNWRAAPTFGKWETLAQPIGETSGSMA